MPSIPEALAAALDQHKAGRLQEAEQAYRQILVADPTSARVWHLLGMIAYQRSDFQAAVEYTRRSLELNPDQADAHNNLGLTLHDQGALDEAAICYRRALRLNPEDATAFHNLAHTLREQKSLTEAEECCRSALQLAPDVVETHVCLATLHLLKGNLEQGWPEYEWRLKADEVEEFALRQFKQPRWNGEPLQGKAILLHSEQGFGDTIQFIRFAPLLTDIGANVYVGCKRELISLISSCQGVSRLISDGDELPPYDFYSPLLTLPGIFKTTLATIPANVPYLSADRTLVAQRGEKRGCENGYRIGINWKGQGGKGSFRHRNIALEHFLSLTSLPGTQWFSLQKEPSPTDADLLARSSIISPPADFDTINGAFMDTAAIMMNLDLVITSDTSVAHLAGALGVPVWVALPFVPDWRWLLDRSDSPWYPTMRLFRQKQPGDWTTVFQDIRAALAERGRSTQS